MVPAGLFDMLSGLGDTFGGALQDYGQRQRLSELGSQLGSGDYTTAAKAAFQQGNLDAGMKLLEFGQRQTMFNQQLEADKKAMEYLGQGYSAGNVNPASPAASAPSASAQPVGQPMQLPGATKKAEAYMPMFAQAASKYGVSPEYLRRSADIESGFNPNSVSVTNAKGLFQFTPGTAKQYGLANPMDPAASTDAAAHLAADNKRILAQRLGREPTDAELYLAHQQGAQGAAALLSNPNAPAASVVGRQAVVVNGGRPDMSAGEFAGMWLRKFGGNSSSPPANTQQAWDNRPRYDYSRGGVQVADASGAVPQSAINQPPMQGQPMQAAPVQAPAVGGQREALLAERDRLMRLDTIRASDGVQRAVKSRMDAIDFKLRELDRESWQTVNPASVGAPADFKGVIQRDAKTGAVRVQKFGPDSQTQVSIAGEKEYDKTVGKGYGEAMLELQKSGRAAPGAISSLNLLERAANTEGFYSGSASELINGARKAAVALGITDAATAAPGEIFAKVSNKLVLDLAGGSLGTGFSNADRDYLASTVPNLSNTPEGNKQIIQIMKAVEQRKVKIAQMARDYAKKNDGRIDAGFDEELSNWSEANPLFKEMPAAQKSNLQAAPPNLLNEARAAISAGKPRAAVIQRMREKGFDPSGL